MSNSRRLDGKEIAKQRLADASELATASPRHPGVAELLHLYERHAEMVQRANAYLLQRNRVVIIASGDTTV